MSPSTIIAQLLQVGKMLNRWRAELRLTVWMSIILGGLWVGALCDVFLQFERTGRCVAWVILFVLPIAVMLERLMKALSRVHTPEAVAVCVEQAFPQLDNHLINFLQFAAMKGRDPFREAYVNMGVPQWGSLDFQAMKNRRTQRRAQLVLGAMILLLLIPLPLVGQAWPVALWRIVNPFSTVAPVSLTHVISVDPGSTSILQGSTLPLSCRVEGQRGHTVWLDIKPADGILKTIVLGSLKGGGVEGFSNTLFKVTTPVKYRFRAGDAFTPNWYDIQLRPPLAFNGIEVKVAPPPYMALTNRTYDAQTPMDVPIGSTVALTVKCNAPAATLLLSGVGEPVALTRGADLLTWSGSVTVSNGAAFVLTATAANGDKAETTLPFSLLPDRPPNIEIITPKQSVALAPGSVPAIDFAISDDFGISEIRVEKLSDPNDKAAPATVLQTYKWITGGPREYTKLWKGEPRRPAEKGALSIRLVACDNSTGTPHVMMSSVITFNMDSVEKAASKRTELEQKALKDLNRVIELQKSAMEKTKQFHSVLKTVTAEQWTGVAGIQKEIRDITRELLDKGGGRTLGNLATTVKKLYGEEMLDVIAGVEGIPLTRDEMVKAANVVKVRTTQEKILRQLTFAELAVAKAKIETRNAFLTAMLDTLVKNEQKIIKATSQCVSQGLAVAETLVSEQDSLGSDVTAFMKATLTEAESMRGDDKDYAAFLDSMAALCESQNIRGDMLLAAEQLEKSKPEVAIGHETTARDKLVKLRAKFEEMVAKGEKEKNEQMIEALQNANLKIEKLKELQKKLLEAMDSVKESKSKDTKKTDKMEEDFEEIEKNIEEALLQVPKDLDIFADLNVGNDMVEDIFSTFEEVNPPGDGTEKGPGAGDVSEKATAKREALLDGMEKIADRMDDLESWLKGSPDSTKFVVEAFDKEEMPNGVALSPLQTKMEDIVGDLLAESKELQDKDKDSAINQATPDMQVSGPITEGDTTCFSAKGRSGNETPDHKEQDGRSNVGRQGMSNGETSAGSGTIGKGDDEIEARRTNDPTQSGQVNLDGEDIKTKATGGGKLGTGKGDKYGMGGGKDRMDSTEAGSMEGMNAMMAKAADQAYAQASMKGMRADSIKKAAHHIRQLDDAIAKGNIDQVAELKRKAVAALKKAKTELESDNAGSLDDRAENVNVYDMVDAGPEEAPAKYRDLVSEYYKKLSEAM